MTYASAESVAILNPMSEAKATIRVSVDLPRREHEKLFSRCKFKFGNLSMSKRIVQLVQADNAGTIEVPHEPGGKTK